MSKQCKITSKRPLKGHKVSHANNKTKRFFLPNLQTKRFWSQEQSLFIKVKVCTSAIRTIDKEGIDKFISKL